MVENNPVILERTKVNVKTLGNSFSALATVKDIGIYSRGELSGPPEDPKVVEVDFTFEKVADGMQRGSLRELERDGNVEITKVISREYRERV